MAASILIPNFAIGSLYRHQRWLHHLDFTSQTPFFLVLFVWNLIIHFCFAYFVANLLHLVSYLRSKDKKCGKTVKLWLNDKKCNHDKLKPWLENENETHVNQTHYRWRTAYLNRTFLSNVACHWQIANFSYWKRLSTTKNPFVIRRE